MRNLLRYRLCLIYISRANDLRLQGCLEERDTSQNNILSEEQLEDSNECHMLRRSPFPWPRRLRRLSNKTTARMIKTTNKTPARDAATITKVEELSLSPLCASSSGAEEVKVETVNRETENRS